MKKRYLIMITFLTLGTVFNACSSGTDQSGEKPVPNIAVLLTEGFHDAEAYMPMGYLVNKGYDVTVIGPGKGMVKAYNSDFTIVVERDMDEVSTDDFAVLVIPGGMLRLHYAKIRRWWLLSEHFSKRASPWQPSAMVHRS